MKPVILFREQLAEQGEKAIAEKYFSVYGNRSKIPLNSNVIGRYSVLPYYKELVLDLEENNSKLVNSFRQHNYIADLGNWYNDLNKYTPKTWFNLEDIPEDGPFVLKGVTNSKKFQWNSHMFAKTKKDAVEVYLKLQNDNLIAYQNIVIREYVPLKTHTISFGGLPITHEFRCFVYNSEVVSKGFYWANFAEEIDYNIDDVPNYFLNKIIKIVGKNSVFYTIDIAQLDNGEWILIELNDGQMSGLSCNDADILYSNIAKLELE